MALIDTNCNPDPIDYPIPCNDDALKSVKLIIEELSSAIIEQKKALNLSFGEDATGESESDDGEESLQYSATETDKV